MVYTHGGEARLAAPSLSGALPPLWIGEGPPVQFLWVSPTLEESLGHPAREWTTPGFIRRLVYPEDLDPLMEAWQRVARTRQPLAIQFRAVSAQGRIIPLHVELNALDTRTGGGEGVLGIVRELPSRQPVGPDPGMRCEEEVAQALSRAQREHREFIDNIDGIVWEATAEFHFTFVSQQAERLLGYPTRCWSEEPDFWVNHLHPDDRVWASSFCVKATEECRPHELEYRMVAADGRTVWLRDIVTVIAEGHRPTKLRGIMVDVTEQHWNRERLQHTVSLLRATLDSTTDGLLVTNLNGRITAANRRFQDLWRIPDELMDSRRCELTSAHILGQLQHPEQYLAQVRELEARPEAESFDDLEFLDGRIIERSSMPQRQGEDIIGRVWSFRDVTQRVRTEQERDRLLVAEQAARVTAEESFALLDTFLNNAPIGLGFLDRDLRYLRLNDSLAALHGKRREDEVGRTVREVVPEMAAIIESQMRQVLDTGEPRIDIELRGVVPVSPDEQRHWRVSYYPVRTPSGGIVGVGAVVVEVTAERRAQKERERLLAEAHEAIRVRDDFLSIASHELKTPLTPLTLHLEMLKHRAAAGQPTPPAVVEKALAQVKQLSGLINDLLDTSRIGAGRLKLEPKPLRIRELLREVVADFRQSSVRHEFECEGPEEDLVVQGDRDRLAQVLTNLLENAIKYSPTGGTVRVACARRGAEFRISVSDAGIGIPADQQEHLFERFFRARNAPISGFGGLGLGLYICRDIVESHGGRIWVESEAGQGSTFHFTLPLVSATDRAPPT